jgi:ATP-dependent DNA helicase RecQ
LKKNIKAVAVYSGLSYREMDMAIDSCIYGDMKFLYLSPERLTTDIIRTRLPKMKVNLLAVDEAHCISQWGHDFRPPYLQIAQVRELLPGTPVLALTATATAEIVDDICKSLEFKSKNIYKRSFERKNLVYAVLQEENKDERLLKICRKVKGTGIVYVRSRKKCSALATFLNKNGITADYYHAGLDSAQRDKKQLAWHRENIRVIVATNAFGMGIDKSNVRFVVHYDLPDSPEAYFQEAGRAGRDELKAYAVLLFNNSDLLDLEKFHQLSFPGIDFIKSIYNVLGNYFQMATGGGKDRTFEFILSEFCSQYNLDKLSTFSALRFLEREGLIMLSEAFSNPSKIIILLNNDELYRFMVANPAYESLIKTLLRSYSGLFTSFSRIDEQEIASRFKTTSYEVVKRLEKLHQMRVIHYEVQSEKPRLTFINGRMDPRDVRISPETYAQRKTYAYTRIEAIKAYIGSSRRCRSQLLLDYFGHHDAPPCHQCDVCIDHKKNQPSDSEMESMQAAIQHHLEKGELSVKEIVDKLDSRVQEKKVLIAIQWLMDNQRILTNHHTGKLRWISQ